MCSQSSDNYCHSSCLTHDSHPAGPPACHFSKLILPRKSFFSALYRPRAPVLDKQDIKKTFKKQKKITKVLSHELISQILGKHIFLGIIPSADQKQNFCKHWIASNFRQNTQLSAENTAVNKTDVVSALRELGVQGTTREDKCQTNNYNIIKYKGRAGVSARDYPSKAEIVIYVISITLLCPPKP